MTNTQISIPATTTRLTIMNEVSSKLRLRPYLRKQSSPQYPIK